LNVNERQARRSPAKRREEILRHLAANGECTVEDMARYLGVSGMTIRRDLRALAAAGRITRTHGGAAATSQVSFEFRFLRREKEHRDEKQAIAAAAAALVADGQTVMLDSGTTTLALARLLRGRQRGLTVITTSLPIASALFGWEGAQLLLLGGFLRHDSPDLIGPVTQSNIESLHGDVAFVGAEGIDEEGNVYNSPALAHMLGRMADACDRVYIVADHSKLGRRAMVRYGRLAQWTGLITDAGADAALVDSLRQHQANVILAEGATET